MPQKIAFHVVHASSHDDNFQAQELNTHSPLTRGWQSAKYCVYPQDVIVQLQDRSQTKKIQLLSHQSLIATRVEFYIGDVPPELPLDLANARYTRLGYVALSDNEQTEFKARELKSVHVNAVGVFLKLVIHKNHINQHNPYNQVGIVAINVIGDKMTENQDDQITTIAADPDAAAGRPDYISPLDDLAFDMYQDAEVAQIIRKLEKKKQEAVIQERYDFAKRLKQGIIELQKVGEQLGKYEVEKRQAVEAEDYDKAKVKKVQMEEYRLKMYKELYVHDLLELSGPSRFQASDQSPRAIGGTDPLIVPSQQPQAVQSSDKSDALAAKSPLIVQSYDDKPLPSLANRKNQLSPDPQDSAALQSPVQAPDSEADITPRGLNEADGAAADEPAELTEAETRQASAAIEVFGLPLVQKAYSKSWSLKAESLIEMTRVMADFQGEKEDARAMFRAAVLLLTKHLKDKVYAIFKSSVEAQQYMLTTFSKQHKLPKGDLGYCIEKTLPEIMHRCADTAARTRSDAKACVISFCEKIDPQYLHFVLPILVKPFKLSIPARNAQSRVDIVADVYDKLKLDDSYGFTLEALMSFLTNGLNHTAGSVRSASEHLIIQLYKEHGAKLKEHLPPDDEKTRKNILYRQLFEALDQIDGKPTKKEVERKKAEEEAAKAAEVEALRLQITQLKAQQNAAGGQGKGRGAAPQQPTAGAGKERPVAAPGAAVQGQAKHNQKAAPAGAGPSQIKDKKKDPGKGSAMSPATAAVLAPAKSISKNSLSVDDDAISTITKFDRTCIFCNEHNEDFNEEGLDLHYWKSCPMLKRCTHCKQVVEVAGLTEHLLTECESKGNYSKCHRCSEAVLTPELDEHVKSSNCNPNEAQKIHCPLCHLNVSQGDNDWLDHLMGGDGCKQNPRRVAALNRQTQAKPAASKGKAAAPVASGATASHRGGTAVAAGGKSHAIATASTTAAKQR